MESLARRTALALAHHPAPAIPFSEAVEAARESGMPVTEGVLLRSLRAAPDLFRVIEPWRGPWVTGSAEPWLVPLHPRERDAGGGQPAGLLRLRTCVVWLARTLDDRSTPAMARWLALVREEERVRRVAVRRSSSAAGTPKTAAVARSTLSSPSG